MKINSNTKINEVVRICSPYEEMYLEQNMLVTIDAGKIYNGEIHRVNDCEIELYQWNDSIEFSTIKEITITGMMNR